MRKIFLYNILFIFLLTFFSFNGVSKKIPDKPSEKEGLVHDWANILSGREEAALEKKLQLYEDSTSTQIAIVIDTSLAGEEAFNYSNRLAEKWEIGQKDKDNGLLLYFAMKEGKIRIQTGYGMEPVVTDAASKKIIEKYLSPAFKQKQYFKGLNKATTAIIKLAEGEFKAKQTKEKDKKGDSYAGLIIPLFIILVFVISMFNRYKKVRHNHFGDSLGFWTLLMLMGTGGGLGRHGGSWDNFSGGAGDFGGGDFGGFGGGDFGGGGAGGDF